MDSEGYYETGLGKGDVMAVGRLSLCGASVPGGALHLPTDHGDERRLLPDMLYRCVGF